jgi:nicotinamide-nucleotide amidase
MASTIDKYLVGKAGAALRRLKAAGLTVATAESCTAGLIAAALARGEGASDVLHGGFVTYTKANKAKALGVSRKMLAAEGSVTANVAKAMALGALTRSPADIALSVTGVLGPTCDEDGNPVGLVYFCCARRQGKVIIVRRGYGRAAHDKLRRRAVIDALALLGRCASRKRRLRS